MSDTITAAPALTAKDFATDQEVRWCPGCGDYSIFAQVQKVMPTLGIPEGKYCDHFRYRVHHVFRII